MEEEGSLSVVPRDPVVPKRKVCDPAGQAAWCCGVGFPTITHPIAVGGGSVLTRQPLGARSQDLLSPGWAPQEMQTRAESS